jgi:hypothetical protein
MSQDMRSTEIGSVRQCLNDRRHATIITTLGPTQKSPIRIDTIFPNQARMPQATALEATPIPAMRSTVWM